MPRGGRRPGAGRKSVDGKSAREIMRDIALDPDGIANAQKQAKTDAMFWLRCYEAGFGKPPQAIGLTVEDKRDQYTVVLPEATEIPALTTTTTIPSPDFN